MWRTSRSGLTLALVALAASGPASAEEARDPGAVGESPVAFESRDGSLQITIGGRQIADYVYNDDVVRRPYFRHLRTLSGTPVTRNHPPIAGQDSDDHATMHPGLWLAFGDIDGADVWRNQARVRHVRFVEKPEGQAGRGSFAVENVYEDDGRIICTERCEITIHVRPAGYRLDWTSTFRSEQDFTFGDQEEMGLGVRMATPFTVMNGGRITDSEGRQNEPQVWGKQASWCEYSGTSDGQRIGVVLMPHPQNFRPSWFHARDYGLLVANAFGRNAFTMGEKSRVTVNAGDEFQLRFGVLVYGVPTGDAPDLTAAYREYVEAAGNPDDADGNSAGTGGTEHYKVTLPPEHLKLPDFYEKYVDASGFPIVSSGRVNDYALKEAAYLVDLLLAKRPDVRAAMVESGSRLVVIGHSEFTTDIPEYARFKPKDFWDVRARGLGGSSTDPICSCGEENLLAYPGDPYATECILIHEFAHNIHLRGMARVEPTFDERLKAAYDTAMSEGLWAGTYASTNHHEYFAEGVQSWFDNNRPPDHDHNHVDTRAELREYDPRLAALCEEVFGDTQLVYSKPGTRLEDHLSGYDPASAPTFQWPERLTSQREEIRRKAEARRAKAAAGTDSP